MSRQEFGLCLKNIRQKRHITQIEVSKKLGISRQAYSSYEQGVRLPDVNTLAALSVILDANLFLFFMDSALKKHKPDIK
ncbi:MAG: helix-turn-helix transcriptional regulator [Lachnospiraceae bacterium]|nr:helix-turn-helix transcriptional regulator [Lachnospiraceae bacterium]